ncbi:MAG: hypothetical protein KGH64_04605, partial [Candidatus Micrarchaeota archaeon]|nr:hypothetical protein [Candidatus Micrarchaeota archaeon]
FLWLSRAEIAFGTDIAGRDMVKETKVALSDKNSLETSKVIRDYAEMFDAPIDFALNEFEIRVKKSTNP